MSANVTTRLKEAYVESVAWLLLVTAVVKLAGVLTASTDFLRLADPLIPFMNNGMVMLAAAMLEFVCFVLIKKNYAGNIGRQFMVILWCSSIFASYRLGLFAMDYQGPCKCLGSWGAILNLSNAALNTISFIIFLYLLVPSLFLYIFVGRSGNRNELWPHKNLFFIFLFSIYSNTLHGNTGSATVTNSRSGIINLEGVYYHEHQMIPRYYSEHGRFRIWIDWPLWSISYDCQSSTTNKWNFYGDQAAMCTEEGVYILRRMSKLNVRRADLPVNYLHVFPGNIPPPFEGVTYHLWLATIAPSLWTNNVGLGYGPNISDASMFFNTNALTKYTYYDDGLDTRELIFHKNGTFFGRNLQKRARLMMIELPPLFTNGYNYASVRWSNHTNYKGYRVPLLAEIKRYIPIEAAISEQQLTTSSIATIMITNIIVENEKKVLPALLSADDVAFVEDFRFQKYGVAKLPYVITNSIPSMNDRMLTKYALAYPKRSLEDVVFTEMGYPPISEWKKNIRWQDSICDCTAFSHVCWCASMG